VYDRDFHVAAQQFERALELNPNYATGRLWYGLMLLDLGRFEEARAQFMNGLEGDPLSSALRANLATCDFFVGKYEEAIAGLRREVELAPDSPFPYLNLGRVYIQKGDYPNGLGTLRRAQKMAADDPMFDAVLGYGLARAGRRAEAEEVYSRLLRESSERRVASYYLAVMSVGLDRRDDVLRWLEEVLRERHVGGLSFAVEPEFASLRGDPRFQNLRRRAGLN
jgi:tetratricopeptide (TPR) repeat protein